MNRFAAFVRPDPYRLCLSLGVASIGLAATVCAIPTTAQAAGTDPIVVWQEPVTIGSWPDSGSEPELVATFHDGLAEVLLARNGGISYSQLSMVDSVQAWSAPTTLVPDGSGAGHPALTHAYLVETMAIWHAPSLSQSVIYSRIRNGGTWEGTQTVSSPVGHSMHPVAAAGLESGFGDIVVAWDDSTSSGWCVRARSFRPTGPTPGWGDIVTFGAEGFDARDPDLLLYPILDRSVLVWSDSRNGGADLLTATYHIDGDWWSEQVLADVAFDLRHPRLEIELSGDTPNPIYFVTSTVTGTMGADEVYATRSGWCSSQEFMLSADDGIPSHGLAMEGLSFRDIPCGIWDSNRPVFLPSWIEEGSGIQLERFDQCSLTGSDFLSSSQVIDATLAEDDGTTVQVWAERDGGQVHLRARVGSTLACYHEVITGLTPLLIGPEGEPPTRLRFLDSCGSGTPVVGRATIDLNHAFEGVTFDPTMSHAPSADSDENGYVTIPLLGGGCSPSSVHVIGGDYCSTDLQGIHSPDIDGDCAVTDADRDYVLAYLGTSDFCADIDGSGLVDEADLAIVDATLGDACSNVTDVDNPIGSFALGLTVRPNPARDFAIVRLGVSTATESTPGLVRIVDASGRLVRSFPAEGAQSGGGIRWDLSDSSGRPLPAGIYFAVAHRSEDELRAPILIVR
ncbi:MAG: hypothetical protein H6682_11525 [Candidatus Eisenbacteria bacterium]|nr:hypothetical protein [Candidatus Eisenbacteria bacterium]